MVFLQLKNGLQRKRYLVRQGNIHFASVRHFALHYNLNPSIIYKEVKEWLSEGNKKAFKRPLVTKTFEFKGHKVTITIHNKPYKDEELKES